MDETEDIIEKLRSVLAGPAPELTASELKKLRAMIGAYDMFLSSGRLGRWIITGAITMAAAVAAFIKLADYLHEWLRGGVQ